MDEFLCPVPTPRSQFDGWGNMGDAAYCPSPISSMDTCVSLVLSARTSSRANVAMCGTIDFGRAFEEYENVLEAVCHKGDRESVVGL